MIFLFSNRSLYLAELYAIIHIDFDPLQNYSI